MYFFAIFHTILIKPLSGTFYGGLTDVPQAQFQENRGGQELFMMLALLEQGIHLNQIGCI